MGCSPDLVKDLLFGELPAAERSRVEQHVAACATCREERERLELTRTALSGLREEEVPRRIAFVSDRVFEPRWWQVWWNSAARLGFAAAALLAVAILVDAGVIARYGPRPVVAPLAGVPGPDQGAIEARILAAVNERVAPAVARAVADAEARHAQETARLVEAAEQRFEFNRRADRVAVEEYVGTMRKQMNRLLIASNEVGGPR